MFNKVWIVVLSKIWMFQGDVQESMNISGNGSKRYELRSVKYESWSVKYDKFLEQFLSNMRYLNKIWAMVSKVWVVVSKIWCMVQQSMSFYEGGSVKYDLFDGVSWEDMNRW